jgi:hypothetical protein
MLTFQQQIKNQTLFLGIHTIIEIPLHFILSEFQVTNGCTIFNPFKVKIGYQNRLQYTRIEEEKFEKTEEI